MTTTAEILEEAFRESSLTTELNSPTPTQMRQAKDRLQAIVNSAYGFEVGEPLTDWPVGLEGMQFPAEQGWTQVQWERPRINVRLIAASSSAQTVYLPEQPYDGSRVGLIDPSSRLALAPLTINGNGRTIGGAASFVANTNALSRIWFYRADLGNWLAISPISYEDEFPFPGEFDDYFITTLAMRLNPRYGRSMTQETIEVLKRSLTLLQARYRQSENVGVDPALLNRALTYGNQNNGVRVNGDRGWML